MRARLRFSFESEAREKTDCCEGADQVLPKRAQRRYAWDSLCFDVMEMAILCVMVLPWMTMTTGYGNLKAVVKSVIASPVRITCNNALSIT